MSKISNVAISLGLTGRFTPASQGASGSLVFGKAATTTRLPTARMGYTVRALIANGATFSLDLSNGDTTGSTSWVAGTQQVETLVVSGTVSASGNLTVTVTATGMSGSPLALSVPVLNGDSATAVATKIRSALAANIHISPRFEVGGLGANVQLLRKPFSTFNVGGTAYSFFYANDTALNIALANGTAAGLSAVTNSTNTTSGVVTSGVKLFDGDGNDLEGEPLVAAVYFRAIHALVEGVSGSFVDVTGGVVLPPTLYPDSEFAIRLPNTPNAGVFESGAAQFVGNTGLTSVTLTFFGDVDP